MSSVECEVSSVKCEVWCVVCVCVGVGACVRACVRACLRACVRACVRGVPINFFQCFVYRKIMLKKTVLYRSSHASTLFCMPCSTVIAEEAPGSQGTNSPKHLGV